MSERVILADVAVHAVVFVKLLVDEYVGCKIRSFGTEKTLALVSG